MKTVTIKTDPQTDYLRGRNGTAKLSAIQVLDACGMVHIDGVNSRGDVVANSGFRFASNPAVLRTLSQTFAALADEAEQVASAA